MHSVPLTHADHASAQRLLDAAGQGLDQSLIKFAAPFSWVLFELGFVCAQPSRVCSSFCVSSGISVVGLIVTSSELPMQVLLPGPRTACQATAD